MKILMLFGKCGTGKGTKSKELELNNNYTIVGGSNVLRKAATNKSSEHYDAIKNSLNNGVLISNEIINDLMKDEIINLLKEKKNIVFDGYPRKVGQLDFLFEIFENFKDELSVSAIIYEASNEFLEKRILNRLVCSECQSSFNVLTQKPQEENICDFCGGELISRKDDTRDVFYKRIKEYEETMPEIHSRLKSLSVPILKFDVQKNEYIKDFDYFNFLTCKYKLIFKQFNDGSYEIENEKGDSLSPSRTLEEWIFIDNKYSFESLCEKLTTY